MLEAEGEDGEEQGGGCSCSPVAGLQEEAALGCVCGCDRVQTGAELFAAGEGDGGVAEAAEGMAQGGELAGADEAMAEVLVDGVIGGGGESERGAVRRRDIRWRGIFEEDVAELVSGEMKFHRFFLEVPGAW